MLPLYWITCYYWFEHTKLRLHVCWLCSKSFDYNSIWEQKSHEMIKHNKHRVKAIVLQKEVIVARQLQIFCSFSINIKIETMGRPFWNRRGGGRVGISRHTTEDKSWQYPPKEADNEKWSSSRLIADLAKQFAWTTRRIKTIRKQSMIQNQNTGSFELSHCFPANFWRSGRWLANVVFKMAAIN